MSHSLCITGMHRSGTSLTASWLERCGLAIHDGEVWGPDEGNVRGHFEDKSFVELHADAIRSIRPRSQGWKVFPGRPLSFEDRQLARARQLIGERNGKFPLWGWKDPRSVLFLEQWKSLLPGLNCLIVFRSYSAVAGSLVRRSRETGQPHLKASAIDAARLYRCYSRLICAFKRRHPDHTLLLPLDLIIGQDEGALKLINGKFGLQLGYRPLSDQFDGSLMHKAADPMLVRWLGVLFGVKQAEEELSGLLDSKPTPD